MALNLREIVTTVITTTGRGAGPPEHAVPFTSTLTTTTDITSPSTSTSSISADTLSGFATAESSQLSAATSSLGSDFRPDFTSISGAVISFQATPPVTETPAPSSTTASSAVSPAGLQTGEASQNSQGGLSQNATIGIGVGVGIGVALFAVLLTALCLSLRRRRQQHYSSAGGNYEPQNQSEAAMVQGSGFSMASTAAAAHHDRDTVYDDTEYKGAAGVHTKGLGYYDAHGMHYADSDDNDDHQSLRSRSSTLGSGAMSHASVGNALTTDAAQVLPPTLATIPEDRSRLYAELPPPPTAQQLPPSASDARTRESVLPHLPVLPSLQIPRNDAPSILSQDDDERTPLHSRSHSLTRSVSPVSPVSPLSQLTPDHERPPSLRQHS